MVQWPVSYLQPFLATPRAPAVMSSAAGLFGVTVLTNVTLAQGLPLNPLELLWDGRQWLYLLALYLLLSVPFCCAAAGIGVAFTQWGGRIPGCTRVTSWERAEAR